MRNKYCLILLTLCLCLLFEFIQSEPIPSRFSNRIDYEAIDKHVHSTPKSARNSVEELAEYLTAPADNNWEKVRAIFKWITENISYDLNSDYYGDGRASSVLQHGSSVCGGYSNLFEALTDAAGLESKTIDGYSKGRGYRPCSELAGPPDHAWNAVKLDGNWYLVDCTWGAGHVDQRGEYIREFDEHYFLTPPEEFIYDHFPSDENWQLLDDPIDLSTYENMPLLKSYFFKYSLRLDSHKECLIKSDGGVRVSILAPADATLIAEVIYNHTCLPNNLTLVQKNGDTCQINALFPQNGEYILRIYAAASDNSDNMYDWVMDYKVLVANTNQAYSEFPKCYQSFYDMNAYLISPLEGILATNHYYDFTIKLPGADTVEIEFDGTAIPLEKDIYNPGTFRGRVFVPQNSQGKLGIRTPHPAKKLWYQVLLEYKLAK
jgi:transglutaminase/protease-like cytokinesis protein 3